MKTMHLWVPTKSSSSDPRKRARDERPRVIERDSSPPAPGDVFEVLASSADDARAAHTLALAWKGGEPPEDDEALAAWVAGREARRRVRHLATWVARDGELVKRMPGTPGKKKGA